MPVVLRMGRFHFFFFSNEGSEPPHIHVRAGGDQAKFWLNPIQLEISHGFNGPELNRIRGFIEDYQVDLLEAWNEHFNT